MTNTLLRTSSIPLEVPYGRGNTKQNPSAVGSA